MQTKHVNPEGVELDEAKNKAHVSGQGGSFHICMICMAIIIIYLN